MARTDAAISPEIITVLMLSSCLSKTLEQPRAENVPSITKSSRMAMSALRRRAATEIQAFTQEYRCFPQTGGPSRGAHEHLRGNQMRNRALPASRDLLS